MLLQEDLLRYLRRAERLYGEKFVITSGYREGDPRCHGRGLAVDIACDKSHERMGLIKALTTAGFRRIGLGTRHIHADRCMDRTQDVLWLEEDHDG